MSCKTRVKGELACLKFDLRALEKGGISSKPLMEVPYDRVLDLDGRLYRVQIKYANSKGRTAEGALHLSLRRTSHTGKISFYKDSEVDILVVYIPMLDKLCWIGDKTAFINRNSLELRYAPPKNNQKKGCRLIKDYIW